MDWVLVYFRLGAWKRILSILTDISRCDIVINVQYYGHRMIIS